jgi:hypothetical protein
MLKKSRIKVGLATAIAMVLIPAALAFAVSGNYTGTTSQGSKCGGGSAKCTVKIHVVKNVVQTDSHILWRANCKSSPKARLTGDTAMHGPLKTGNKFHVKGTYTQPLQGGLFARDTVNLSFTVKAHKAPGSLDVSAVVHSASGGVIDHCKSPHVTFTAHK